jgi:hypothetical protein
MRFRITVFFGPYAFTVDCDNVAVAFRHIEALILSPMCNDTEGMKQTALEEYLLRLADMARGKVDAIENGAGLFRVDRIGRRRA